MSFRQCGCMSECNVCVCMSAQLVCVVGCMLVHAAYVCYERDFALVISITKGNATCVGQGPKRPPHKPGHLFGEL